MKRFLEKSTVYAGHGCESSDFIASRSDFVASSFENYIQTEVHDYMLDDPETWSCSSGWDTSERESDIDSDGDFVTKGELQKLNQDASDMVLPQTRMRERHFDQQATQLRSPSPSITSTQDPSKAAPGDVEEVEVAGEARQEEALGDEPESLQITQELVRDETAGCNDEE